MASMKCMNNIFGRPCGYCMACRMNRQRDKKLRLCHELQSWKDSVFITLTYNDEHLPAGRTLVKRDLQLFLKRFRKAVEPRKIKYFACGEYGDDNKTSRPHYHLIIYGIGIKDPVFKNKQYVPSKDVWYCSCGAWEVGGKKIGYVSLNPVTPARCSYVAKYCLKKVGGPLEKEHYGERVREFCLSSRGIGLEWLKNHITMIKKNLTYIQQGRQKVAIPRYYIDKALTTAEKVMRTKLFDKMAHNNNEKDYISAIESGKDFGTWLKEMHEARFARFYKRLQMKGKTNNV